MKRMTSLMIACSISALLLSNDVCAQGKVSPEVASIVSMSLKDGQAKLESLGYRLCSSSLSGTNQSWFNESARSCVTVKFNKDSKQITEVVPKNNISACERGLAAFRKSSEMYHDGQAPASGVRLDLERRKLADKGFKVSYWISEPSPGRNAEYWINEQTRKVMYIVWEIRGSKWVKTDNTTYNMGHKPS